MDQPSQTMWCMVRSKMWFSSDTLNKTSRNSGPRARSNGRPASSRASIIALPSFSSSLNCVRSTISTLLGTDASTIPKTPSSCSAKMVRRHSCLRMISVRQDSRAAGFSNPSTRTAPGMLYAGLLGSNWCATHNLSWAKDSGTRL